MVKDDGSWVATSQKSDMDGTHVTKKTTVTTGYPDGTVQKRTTAEKTPLKNIFYELSPGGP